MLFISHNYPLRSTISHNGRCAEKTSHKKVPSGNGTYVFQLISMYVFRHRHSRSGGRASNKFSYIYEQAEW